MNGTGNLFVSYQSTINRYACTSTGRNIYPVRKSTLREREREGKEKECVCVSEPNNLFFKLLLVY